MENFNALDKQMLTFLKTYNLIKKDPMLTKLAEDLENEESSSTSESANKNSDVIQEINTHLKEISESILKTSTIQKLINNEKTILSKRKTRVYMDGVFDIIHSGHFNALRQGKRFGDILVCGINSDADVEKAKGPPLMNVQERAALAGACKWVDEVIIDTPYSPTLELLDQLNIDFCVHGDDPCFNELGEDVYGPMKKAGRFKVFKRTEGISTTEIIGRLLTLTKENVPNKSIEGGVITSSSLLKKVNNETGFEKGPVVSSFLTTGRRLHEFCNNKVPKETDRVVYLDGAWDILHIGHIEILKKAKELGDFVYVGVHDDLTVNERRGRNYPILNLQERVFNLLAMKYVDDVVIGAPWIITQDLIKSLRIDTVIQGTQAKYDQDYTITSEVDDPYAVPKKLGIYKEVNSEFDTDSEVLVKRIFEKRDHYLKKYQKKSTSESGYYQNKEYLREI
jgi:ethanolamine-phosphate cytidylyltransferase